MSRAPRYPKRRKNTQPRGVFYKKRSYSPDDGVVVFKKRLRHGITEFRIYRVNDVFSAAVRHYTRWHYHNKLTVAFYKLHIVKRKLVVERKRINRFKLSVRKVFSEFYICQFNCLLLRIYRIGMIMVLQRTLYSLTKIHFGAIL